MGIPPPKTGIVLRLEALGAPGGRKRWRDRDSGELFEWDGLHGHWEVYTKRGYHSSVQDVDGKFVGGPVKGRRIDV
jgi:hypothetical protein